MATQCSMSLGCTTVVCQTLSGPTWDDYAAISSILPLTVLRWFWSAIARLVLGICLSRGKRAFRNWRKRTPRPSLSRFAMRVCLHHRTWYQVGFPFYRTPAKNDQREYDV